MKPNASPRMTELRTFIRLVRECADQNRADAERARRQLQRSQLLLATAKPWDPFRD